MQPGALPLSRRGLMAVPLLAAGQAAAQAADFRTRLARLRVGANLERWFPVTRDNHARRLGRAWWREFRAAGFDHVRFIVPADGIELFEMFHDAIADATAAGLPVLLALQDIVHQGSPESRDIDGLGRRARWFAARTDPEMVVFAPVNEPAFQTTDTWQPIRDRMLGAIRKEAPRHLLMWGGKEWNSIRSLPEMAPPADPWTIAEVHDYGGGSPAEVRRRFAPAIAWRERYNLPVLCAEYNASGDKQERRERWIEDLRAGLPVLRELNLPATLWSYSHGGWYRLQPEDGPAPYPEVRRLLAQ
ncbi:glycoside hydrolase family 5 protein [Paracraurococcus lichenis]|uniref:Cellulase family glycosylhydrolase n=1 Tax=Paracraurococcus lichenis TaxID=3064888 RepID=A0ABT9DWF6_9PROT|nr:cellulase family glycosylhydrolase [Paracraurococcus sp. LOR1-02]MDO9708235.1 cellulase family glycosylhydrolase [Paracraurococcus sp. LOR1-02]